MEAESDTYSPIANEQLDQLAETLDAEQYNRILDACELILDLPQEAQKRSSATTITSGIIALGLPVVGSRYRVFWTSTPPRVEAVFEYP